MFKSIDFCLRQITIQTRFQQIDDVFCLVIELLDPPQGFNDLNQGVMDHGFASSQVKGYLILIKNGLELQLISFYIA